MNGLGVKIGAVAAALVLALVARLYSAGCLPLMLLKLEASLTWGTYLSNYKALDLSQVAPLRGEDQFQWSCRVRATHARLRTLADTLAQS